MKRDERTRGANQSSGGEGEAETSVGEHSDWLWMISDKA
jgi:hypothetical protein